MGSCGNSSSGESTFTIDGQPPVTVSVVEMEGRLHFTVTVDTDGGTTADLRGIFFDIANPDLVAGLRVSGSDVTDSAFALDDVSNLGGGCNMKGEADPFDAGIEIGTQGIGKDDVQSTTFVLSHESMDLSVDLISGQAFGIRLTSVGSVDGSRDGSLKLTGTAEAVASEPDGEPPVAVADELLLSYNAYEQLIGSVDLLANDSDADGDNADLIVTAINGNAIAPGEHVFLDWFAMVRLEEDGRTVTYTHFEGEPVSFGYTVADATCATAEGEVDVAFAWAMIG